MTRQPSPVRVRIIESDREFAELGESWESLQKDAQLTSVFASFDWQNLWWKHYGPRGRRLLRLLLAYDGDSLVGILPLHIHTVPVARFPVRLLRFVGTGGDTAPDDLGPVLAQGREREVAAALAESVQQLGGWDVLHLTDMNPACPFTAAMGTVAEGARLHCSTGRAARIAFIELPATVDAWYASLHRDRRYRIRSARRKLNAAQPSRFFAWDDPETLDQGIDRLVALHRKRWAQAAPAQHAFSSPEYIAFHRAVMHACLRRDRLRLYCLELEGQIAAVSYFYRFRDAVYLMQSGFDPDYSALKPGQVLLGHVVESAIGEKLRILDFLRGDHRYKDELATGERETVFLTALRPRLGGLVYGARRIYLPALKELVTEAVRRYRRPPPDGAQPKPPADRESEGQ